jgi:hypothetical protein
MPPIAKTSTLRPEWLKPEHASVFDPTYRTAIRWLADKFGLNEPDVMSIGSPMMVPLNPLMTLAPRVPAAQLLEKLAPEGAPANIRAAVEYLIKRYPRLMSHVESLTAHQTPPAGVSPTATAWMRPVSTAREPWLANRSGRFPPVREPLAQIGFDSERIAGHELETLAHEATHVAQAVRQTDLARRIPREPTFSNLYGRMSAAQGYYDNPMEVAARRTANEVLAKKESRYAPRYIAKQLWEATGDADTVKRRLTRLFPKLDLDTIDSAVAYVSTLPR